MKQNSKSLVVKIISVTSPSTIQSIAKEKGLSPLDVFVRIVFKHEDVEYKVSNKLKFLRKEGYESLLKARDTDTDVLITVSDNEFFYIGSNTTSVDDLFKDATPTSASSLGKVAAFFNKA